MKGNEWGRELNPGAPGETEEDKEERILTQRRKGAKGEEEQIHIT